MMIFPKFLKENDTIGVTAPSNGITKDVKVYRLDSAIKNVRKKGFNVIETSNVRKSNLGRSSLPKNQANELLSLYKNKDVDVIICSSGGDFLIEILSYIDFDIIKNNVKWIQGYSDPTSLLFVITTNLDIATIYGDNFCSFGMNPWHESLYNNIDILMGKRFIQNSFSKYEKDNKEYLIGDEPYLLTESVKWKNLNGEEEIIVKGRMIGGCIDCLNDLFGTKYDKTLEFIEKYKNDGIIWYFDNCDLSNDQLIRTLWKFKDSGWFLYAKGIIFGRSAKNFSFYDITLEDAIKYSLNDLNIPIIIDADIGHVAPRMTIINGSIAIVRSKEGKGEVKFYLE